MTAPAGSRQRTRAPAPGARAAPDADGAPTLVADIGGTHARFALARRDGAGGYALAHAVTYKVEDYPHVRDAARDYLASAPGPRPTRGCLAAAAPIEGEDVAFTNSAWRFHVRELAAELELESLRAVNDFAAFARGAVAAPPDTLVPVLPGTPEAGAPSAVLGPGTGLGLGLVVPDACGGPPRILPTQGGHVAFAPRDAVEARVRERLAAELGYVSYESVVSGMGLQNIHRALAGPAGAPAAPLEPAAITAQASDPNHPLARRVVSVFCAILGGFAGEAVVMTGARGGVYLGGGILAKIADLLAASAFAARFRDKGPMSAYVADVPVWLVTQEGAALRGAAALLEETADSA